VRASRIPVRPSGKRFPWSGIWGPGSGTPVRVFGIQFRGSGTLVRGSGIQFPESRIPGPEPGTTGRDSRTEVPNGSIRLPLDFFRLPLHRFGSSGNSGFFRYGTRQHRFVMIRIEGWRKRSQQRVIQQYPQRILWGVRRGGGVPSRRGVH
jgi:hypothetical protein